MMPLRMSTAGDSDEVEFVRASDLDAVQALFSKECDADGLMTKVALEKIPAVAEMLTEGDLLQEELDDIWDAAPKFPSPTDSEGGPDRIDVDSFVQCYRDIDDLFEDDEEGGEGESTSTNSGAVSAPASSASQSEGNTAAQSSRTDADEDPVVVGDEADLEVAYKGICDSTSGLVSKEALRNWDEIKSLFEDGMLGEDEFESIWDQTAKKPGSNDKIDIEGFLSFNVALDDLFVFDDDELEEDEEGESEEQSSDEELASVSPAVIVTDAEMSPKEIFDSICDDDFLIGMDELERWGELQEMLADEELLPIELQNMFNETPKAPGTKDKLNESGFTVLYYAIDDLFEDDGGDDNDEAADDGQTQDVPQVGNDDAVKEELLDYIAQISRDPDLLPCGLDSTEREQERALNIVADLEEQRSNLVITKGGDIQPEDLTGDWDLIFTTSSTMKFNKGLTGLGGSFPNGKFGGVVQMLQATKWTSDIEYKERIEVPAGASFDVTVTGDWKLKGTVNLFTGEPTTVMQIEPDKVEYGPTSTKGDHWKSLGPLNLLDITYLDDDLRVMRGNTSVNTIFIFRRR